MRFADCLGCGLVGIRDSRVVGSGTDGGRRQQMQPGPARASLAASFFRQIIGLNIGKWCQGVVATSVAIRTS